MLIPLIDNFELLYQYFTEGEDCEIQFGESVLLPTAQAYRRDRPDYDPNYDDPDDDTLQFYIALDVSFSGIKIYINMGTKIL